MDSSAASASSSKPDAKGKADRPKRSAGSRAPAPVDADIKVRGESKVAGLAGAIAHTIRDKKSCKIAAIGAQAINQAIKAIIRSRGFLEEDHLDLTIVPTINRDIGPFALQVTVTGVAAADVPKGEATAETSFKASARTHAAKMAGAMANRVREGKAGPLSCSGIGPAAVANMVKAISAAAEYLEDDGFGLVVVPETAVVTVSGKDGADEDRTAMRCLVFVRKL